MKTKAMMMMTESFINFYTSTRVSPAELTERPSDELIVTIPLLAQIILTGEELLEGEKDPERKKDLTGKAALATRNLYLIVRELLERDDLSPQDSDLVQDLFKSMPVSAYEDLLKAETLILQLMDEMKGLGDDIYVGGESRRIQ
jgi:hypothetical protein